MSEDPNTPESPPLAVVAYRRYHTKRGLTWRLSLSTGEVVGLRELSRRSGVEEGCLRYRCKHKWPPDLLLRPSAFDTKDWGSKVPALDVPWEEDERAQRAVDAAAVAYAQGRRRQRGLKLNEIAEMYGCSRELIRQTEHAALRKLRAKFSASELRGMLLDALHKDATTWDLIAAMATYDTGE